VTFLTFLNGPTATVFRTALLRLFSVRPDLPPPPPPLLAAGPEVAAAIGSSPQQPLARLALTNLMIERGAIPSPPSETSSLTAAAFSASQLPVHGKNPFLSTDQIMERNRCCVLLQLMPKNGGFLCCSGAGSAP
jgi:hypothetical protein